jgi:hypothetical protein
MAGKGSEQAGNLAMREEETHEIILTREMPVSCYQIWKDEI